MVKKKKLSKSDPDYFKIIGSISGKKLLKERGKKYFSELAAKSHPREPGTYKGGRPRKIKVEDIASANS
jgi:hypothetical protein